jgi:hypothetical protein
MSQQSLASCVASFVSRGHTVECAKLVVRYFVEKSNKDTTFTKEKMPSTMITDCNVTKQHIENTFGSK